MSAQIECTSSLLCSRPLPVSVAPPTHKQQLVVTVDGDGVACYDLHAQRHTEARPLGSTSRLAFQAPAILDSDTGLFFAAVAEEAQHGPSPSSGAQQFLLSWPSSSSSARKPRLQQQHAAGPRSLSEIPQRVPFPSRSAAAHSLHALQLSGSPPANQPPASSTPQADSNLPAQAFVAAVLADGSVGSCTGDALELSMVASAPTGSPAGRLCAACSRGALLLTLHHTAPAQHALLRVFTARHTLHGPVLAPTHDTPIPCPSLHAMPVSMHLAPSYGLIMWSSGTTTVVQLSTSPAAPGPSYPPKLLHFPLPPALADASAVLANGPLPAAAHAAANGASPAPAASARKRKAPSSSEGPQHDSTAASAPLLAAPLDDTQLVVAALRPVSAAPAASAPAAPSHELHFAVLERQFGVVLHSGMVALEGALLVGGAASEGKAAGHGARAGLTSQPCLLASPGSGPSMLVLQASGSIFCLRLEVPPANLLSMVGRLAVASNPNLTPASASSQQHPLALSPAQPAAATAVAAAATAPLALLTPPHSELNVQALMATLRAKQQQQQALAAAGAAPVANSEAAAGGVQGGCVQPGGGEYELQDLQAVQGLAHTLDTSPAQLEAELAQARLKQQPPSLSTLQQAASLVAATYQQHAQPEGHAPQQQHGPPLGQQARPGRRGKQAHHISEQDGEEAGRASLLAACRLAPLVALACAEGGHWELLHRVLQAVPSHSITGCTGVLLKVAQGQQYQLLPQAACALEDVPPSELVQVVQALLAPTQAGNVEARRAYHHQLRETAESVLQHAEQQLQACQPANRGGGAMAVDGLEGGVELDEEAAHRRSALAQAHCAAAAVDGFALHEALLHVPLALHADAAGLQAHVRQLSNAQVDRLLAYLAKWVARYSHGPLAQLAASNVAPMAALPLPLMCPSFPQVLDWLRVVIDGHLPRLLMAKQPPAALDGLQVALKSKVEACQQLLPLQGAIEHVRAGAPLPHAHVAASTMYTVEYVDLGLPIFS